MSGENTEPQAVPEIGRTLERARQSRGLSFWQVEQETRIRSRYLRDLERENFDVLPAVYVLGSLKTYADFLGLDGAALSRQLKARLVEPAEPDVPAQLAALGGTPSEDEEYEAPPVPAIGFDQLFLGMGVILISILAVMTLVAALAQGDDSPVSQVREPSTPEAPAEIALAGNVQDGDNGVDNGESNTDKDKEEEPEASKNGEDGKDQDEAQAASPFDGVEFVPMSPSFPTTASASAASASVAPSSSPAPATDAPANTAPANTAPARAPSSATVPAATAPGAAGSGAEPGPFSAEPAPATRAPNRPNPQGAEPGDPDRISLAGGITDQVEDLVGSVR